MKTIRILSIGSIVQKFLFKFATNIAGLFLLLGSFFYLAPAAIAQCDTQFIHFQKGPQKGIKASTTISRADGIYVQNPDGTIIRSIYAELKPPITIQPETQQQKIPQKLNLKAEAKTPTVVLLNGLIYDIHRWDKVTEKLQTKGMRVIRLSYAAQPESLRLLREGDQPEFLHSGLKLSDMADDVNRVVQYYQIDSPVTVIGLSYGATVAVEYAKLYPTNVDQILLLSPLVVPLDSYSPQGQVLRSYLDNIRFWENSPCLAYGWLNPWLCYQTKDYWYDTFYNLFYESYLNMRIAETPEDLQPALYKKSVFQLVRAVRDFDLRKEVKGLKNVHITIAENEESHLKNDQLKSWALVPVKERRSFAEFQGVTHALPDEAPQRAADWIEAVVTKSKDLQTGSEFIIEPEP